MIKIRIIYLWYFISASLFFASCSPWGSLDNPLDPGAENYEGVTTVASSSDLYPVYPEPDGSLSGEYLSTNKVAGAVAYEVVIAASEAGLDSAPIYTKSDYTSPLQMSILAAPVFDSTEYFWKIRSKDASGTWGAWSGVFSFTTDWSQPAPQPVFTPGGGIFATGQGVVLSSTDPNADFFYTIDGSAPTTASAQYSGSPIVISGDATITTIRAISTAPGYAQSEIGEAQYTLDYSVWTDRNPNPLTNWRAAVSSSDGSRLAIIGGTSIWTSSDYGATWTERTAAGNRNWYSIASNSDGSRLAATVSSGGGIWASSDYGATWSEQSGAGTRAWAGIASNSDGSKLAAVVSDGSIWTSSDYGVTWTERTSAGTRDWIRITSNADGSKLAATQYLGYIWTSSDSGNTWTQQTAAGYRYWEAIASSADGTRLIAAGGDGTSGGNSIYTSINSGASWVDREQYGNWYSVSMSSDGTRVAVIERIGGYVYTSTDSGATWFRRQQPGYKNWRAIASNSDGTRLLSVGYDNNVWSGVLPP